MKARIKTLSPVHVGNGEITFSSDFILEDGKLHILDLPKLFKHIEESYAISIGKVLQEFKKGEGFILETLLEEYSVDFSKFVKRTVSFEADKPKSQLQVRQFIRTARDVPYIPGSTIKGAIRTALLWNTLKENQHLLDELLNELEILARQGKKKLQYVDDKIEKKIFGSVRGSILRFLRITDTLIDPNMVIRIYKVKVVGSQQTIPVYLECIPPEKTLELEIKISENLLENTDSYINGDMKHLTMTNIENSIKNFSCAIIDQETSYQWPSKATRQFYEKLQKKSLDSLILRIGWGSGWYSTTIGTLIHSDQRFKKFRKTFELGRSPHTRRLSKNFPKTRKITMQEQPLGWVELWIEK